MFDEACENQWRNCLQQAMIHHGIHPGDRLYGFGFCEQVVQSGQFRQLLPRLKGHDAKRVLLVQNLFINERCVSN